MYNNSTVRNDSVFTDSREAATGPQTYTGAGSTQLAYRFWSAGSRSLPVLVYLHGIEGHSLWFDRAAAQLSLRGINVYAADRRGAALNKNADNSSIVVRKTLLSDLDAFLNAIKVQHPDSNLYLLGNCWGGTLSILYAAALLAKIAEDASKTGSALLSGLILSCPAIKTVCDVSLPTKLSIAWSYLCNSKKEFPLPLTPEMFTQNPQYLAFIYNDTLRTTAASASFLIETLKMQRQATAVADLNLPVLLLQAAADAIVDRAAVTRWFARLNGDNEKNYQLFDGACHSLDFEPDISCYLDAITDWIERR